jgi:single-stranded-DNA-specific exonuclease
MCNPVPEVVSMEAVVPPPAHALPPLPRPTARWQAREAPAAAVADVARVTGLPEVLARVLVGRGVDAETAPSWLAPSLKALPDPSRLAGLDAAVDVILHNASQGTPIGVFGDYDVDGVTSTTLLSQFFVDTGIATACTIPDRLVEGYGLSRAGVDRLVAAGCKLLVTVDCGVTNHDEILYAQRRGVEVVVVDHHTVPVELPKAASIINPHRADCTRGSEMLCAVGVTFNLAMALRRKLRKRGWFSSTRPEPDLKDALDLVALGTVADVVPLIGENRILVHNGLKTLKLGKRAGLQALLRVAGIDVARVDAGDLGFQLGPRVNAAGRLGDAMKGVELLRSSGEAARHLASLLDAENQARRSIEKEITAAAIRQVEQSPALRAARAVVVGDERWHPGVVGIVASRLVDRFARPAIVFGEGGRGSARSIEAFHMYDALRTVASSLPGVVVGFGGHAHAAGVRLAPGGLDRFRDAMLAHAEATLRDDDLQRISLHDGPIDGAALRLDTVERFAVAAPFGRKNPEPSFVLPGARLRQVKVLKEEHLKASVDPRTFGVDGHRSVGFIDVIAFGAAARAAEWSGPVDLLVTPDINVWNGTRSVQLRVRDFRASTSG